MTDIPVGGTTGCSHEHTEAIAEAARWLAAERRWPDTPLVVLRSRFGLSSLDAAQALAEARLILVRSH